MSLADAVAEAIAVSPSQSRDAGSDHEPTAAEWFGLTRREVEVLRHLVAGRSNPAIAEALFISPRTAQTHVQNIFGKLGVRSRAEAVRVVLERGLVETGTTPERPRRRPTGTDTNPA